MPVTVSARKAWRRDQRRKVVNERHKEAMKKALKEAGQQRTDKAVVKAYSWLDKAAAKHVIAKRKAARLKSRLMKKIHKKVIVEKTPTKSKKIVKKTGKRRTKAAK